MTQASQKEILRLFPGLPDHAISKIEAMSATVAELDATLLLLTSDDVDLIEQKQRDGGRLNQLMLILREAGVEAPDEES